jgi:hypothetical protein
MVSFLILADGTIIMMHTLHPYGDQGQCQVIYQDQLVLLVLQFYQ